MRVFFLNVVVLNLFGLEGHIFLLTYYHNMSADWSVANCSKNFTTIR